MRIVKGTQPITVEHPVVLIFGQPGICKTSIAYSAEEPLLIDADRGSYRAANRRDTLIADRWADIAEVTDAKDQASLDALSGYKTLVADTVGRVLDLMTADIIGRDPKFARGNSLTLPGFGELKGSFRNWMTRLRTAGKDVVLVAHAKEEKNGDDMIWRPDITGSSYDEVMKVADFVGFLYMRGKDRVLDFNPTDRWVGKNPAGWNPIVVPPVDKAQRFLATLIANGRDALGAISAESADVLAKVEHWRTRVVNLGTAAECTAALVDIAKLEPVVALQVKRLLGDHVKTIGVTWAPSTRTFVGGPTAPAAPLPVVAPPAESALVGELGF